ncbi:MAG: tRNA 2-thiouridine(34) synthase MnmA, partial [Rhodospirillales bacterium]|nr:tRNA 2-thiouridine(34) synthase MnmA [Rhodospirillales bacterium]MCW9001219.1 tRNA 2-thiouridine(34) synthase MnmA [Rhodospirillales bacterium]
RFPLGGMTKDETRAIARRFNLPVAAKKDSQDICFVPDGSYADVVEKLRPGLSAPGEIVDGEGHVLGTHAGLIHYTVGQRRGLGISGPDPLFVLRLDPLANRVIVGPIDALAKRRVFLRDVNWLGEGTVPPEYGRTVSVKVRSMQEPVGAVVRSDAGGDVYVDLDESYRGVAPGQACVFYDGDRLLGGGWIARAEG